MSEMDTAKKVFQRLPKSVYPMIYQITLEPDLVNHTFQGAVCITISFREATDTIVLNSLDLEIKDVSYRGDGCFSPSTQIKKIEIKKEEEQLVITLGSVQQRGSGYLMITFSGVLNDKLRGLYLAKYPQPDGKPDKYAAVSQFAPTDTRRCFPCWDEPEIKATFHLTVVAEVEHQVLSNMPIIKQAVKCGGKKHVSFDVTPMMSTYLLALVVGEFEYVEAKSTDDLIMCRVYTPPGKKEQGRFALEVVTKALPFFSDYFGIPYPLNKMDLIAVSDFAFGAMENWGLVIYRETALLFDPETTSQDRKQYIALVIAHEIAHQWFGNLVTMDWWTHLWLNEGFASFMEFLCVAHLFPEYCIWQQFFSKHFSRALNLDAQHNSHPIEVPINNPAEIDEIFDAISYAKGASVIRMLYSFLGDEDFKKGMTLYLKKHEYKNAATEDLWAALGEASGKPVADIMSVWTKEKGFPVVSVSEKIQDGDQRTLSLTQEKYSSDGKLLDSEKDTLWMIPLTVTSETSPDKPFKTWVMSSKSCEETLTGVPSSSWIKLNHDSVGVYRVQYSPEMMKKLLPAIESKVIPPLDRLNIQDDLFALVQAGKASTVEILKLLDAYRNETEYPVWTSIISCLERINLLLAHTDFQDKYHVWGRKLLLPLHTQLGWEKKTDDKHTDTLFRSLILSCLVCFKEPGILSGAKKLFDLHADGIAPVPPDVRSSVYAAVAKTCDEETFNKFFDLYRKADTQEEKLRLSMAMASVCDSSLIQRLLDFCLTDEVRSQDAGFVIGAVSSNKVGMDLAWNFFKDKRDTFKDKYGTGILASRLVKSITHHFASEEMAEEIERFFQENPFPGTERSVCQSLENIRLNIEWLKRDADDIRAYLSENI